MKQLAPICLALFSACSVGSPRPARSSAEPPRAAALGLVLDFQTGFEDTLVELEVEQQRVLSERLTTDDRVGLARSIRLNPRDTARVSADITLDHAAHYSYDIRLDRGRYVGFFKDLDQGTLRMEQSQQPFEYD